MINVRATQQETERPARARYLFGDAERYSRLPMLLVLAIGSLVAYLKLAFPVRNEDYTPPHETTPADNSSDAPPSSDAPFGAVEMRSSMTAGVPFKPPRFFIP